MLDGIDGIPVAWGDDIDDVLAGGAGRGVGAGCGAGGAEVFGPEAAGPDCGEGDGEIARDGRDVSAVAVLDGIVCVDFEFWLRFVLTVEVCAIPEGIVFEAAAPPVSPTIVCAGIRPCRPTGSGGRVITGLPTTTVCPALPPGLVMGGLGWCQVAGGLTTTGFVFQLFHPPACHAQPYVGTYSHVP